MKTRIATIHVVACLIAAFAAVDVSARTVYDAGKALRENCTSGTYANPYGVWSYHLANNRGVINTVATLSSTKGKRTFTSVGSGTIDGFSIDANQAGSIRTIVSGNPIATDGEPLEVDELFMFPHNDDNENKFPMIRFAAPEAGWYSAFVSAHDLVKAATGSWTDGVRIRVFAQGKEIIHWVVSLEDNAASNPTHRFDFQMPVRYLAAGETIDVVIDRNGGNSNDPTGVKFVVTREDDGAFYDSGIAMTNNIATTYDNPYGNIKDGTWYYLTSTVSDANVDFASWAPWNINNSLSRLTYQGNRSDGLLGFGEENTNTTPHTVKSPYVVVNNADSYTSAVATAPCELQIHPGVTTAWPVIRFRPPVSGYYSASIVARDVIRGKPTDTPTPDGVHVYLLVSGTVVTNVYISAETFSSTAHLTFGPRLLVANEPVDIALFANTSVTSDATGISAIFRREDVGVYDAGKSYYDVHVRGGSVYFSDSFDSAAKWLVAMKADPWAEAHSPLPEYLIPSGNKLTWWVHAVNNSNNGTAPRFAMAADGIVSVDSLYLNQDAPILATTPYELVVQPQNPPQDSSAADKYNASLRAEVPSNGIYRVRSYARDLNNNTSQGDGVRMILSANSYAPASAIVSRDSNDYPYEAALAADRLWLRQGEALYFTVDPRSGSTSDSTALTACYEICDASPSARVINIDFGVPSSVAGRFSNHTGAGREGWDDWNKWNALRISDSTPAATVSVDNCREADGMTKRNVKLTLARTSGNVTKGYTSGDMPTGSALHNNWAKSDSASDTYTFTLSKLKKNEPYTLYLYSAKGGAAGNASFTVGGVTKTADEPWNLKDTKVVARFDVASDSNGEISGTFAAADANGGAFNGLTLVGEFPEYNPLEMIIIFR